MRHIKAYILTALLAGVFFSCMDDTLNYTEYNPCPQEEDSGDREMRLKVSVPKTYSTGAGGA